jgi:hypothetical protein
MAITLLEMLLDAGLLTPAQCDESLQNRVFFGGKIGTSLIELGFLDEESLARFLSLKLSVPFVHPDRFLDIPAGVIRLVSPELAMKYRVIPLGLEKRRLSLVMADPSDLRAVDEIAFITGHVILPLVSPEIRLVQALGKYYGMEVDERYRQILDRLSIAPEEPPPEPAEKEGPEGVGGGWAFPEMTNFADGAVESLEFGADPGFGGEEGSWLERVEQYSPDPVSRALAAAEGREEIADAIVSSLGRQVAFGALFLVRDGVAYGWRAVDGGKELKGIGLLQIPLDDESVLRPVFEEKHPYLGPLEDTPLNNIITDGMGMERPEAVMAHPLLLGERVVNILFLAGREKELEERLTRMEKLLAKSALAFEILIAREKILTM